MIFLFLFYHSSALLFYSEISKRADFNLRKADSSPKPDSLRDSRRRCYSPREHEMQINWKSRSRNARFSLPAERAADSKLALIRRYPVSRHAAKSIFPLCFISRLSFRFFSRLIFFSFELELGKANAAARLILPNFSSVL